MTDIQHRFRVPHPLVLLTGCIILASMASYVLPAGEYERSMDEETGKIAVVSGTYEQVEQTPVNFFLAMVALPRGMVDAGGVIFLVFLIGGALTVVDETGALRRGISSLVRYRWSRSEHAGGNHPPDPCRLDRNLPTGVYPPGCYVDKCRRGLCRICLQSDQSIPSLDRPRRSWCDSCVRPAL